MSHTNAPISTLMNMNEVDICIRLVNLIEKEEITDRFIIDEIEQCDYLAFAQKADSERIGRLHDKYTPSWAKSFTEIVQNILNVLKSPEQKGEPLYMRRYQCSYLDIKTRVIATLWDQNTDVDTTWAHIQKADYPIMCEHLLLYLIQNMVENDAVEASYFYIEQMPVVKTIGSPEDTRFRGFRLLLPYFIKQLDLKRFKETLKKCNARVDRDEIENYKGQFVSMYSKQNNLEASMELCNDKVFGAKYLYNVLEPLAEQGNYLVIQKILADNVVFEQAKQFIAERILVNAYEHDMAIHTQSNVFEQLFTLINNLDPKPKWGDVRLRDSLLFDIGNALRRDHLKTYYNMVIRCRKAIKNNWLKGELPLK